VSTHALPRLSVPRSPATDSVRSLVVAERLEKYYDLRPVVRGISFALPAGQTLALLGANGAGKTTLLRLLATLIKPTGGGATIQGLDLVRDATEVRRLVGYVGHTPLLYEDLSARENLLYFARMFGLRDGVERAERLLAWVGLRSRAGDRARQLSRGQLQRLSLARGVLHEPLILLLDEPDTGLDEDATSLLTELVHDRTQSGQATLLTTHHLERGLALADLAMVLARGSAVYCGPAHEVSAAEVRRMIARPHGSDRSSIVPPTGGEEPSRGEGRRRAFQWMSGASAKGRQA
jgi:heme ABC exporter ATP-binding subunit CcmA